MTEADEALACMEPTWTSESLSIFNDHMPKAVDKTQDKVAEADEKVSILNKDARKAQFEADTLALARDIAQIGAIYKEVTKSENARRQEKVVHLRAQNVIGASIVSDFMTNNLAVMSGVIKDQMAAVDRVWGPKQHSVQLFYLISPCSNSSTDLIGSCLPCSFSCATRSCPRSYGVT